jgi:hypothetical protein
VRFFHQFGQAQFAFGSFNFKLKAIFDIAPTASKFDACYEIAKND